MNHDGMAEAKKLPKGPVLSVRLLVRDVAGRVLLLRRAARSFAGGQWCLPGGKVDYLSRVEAAVEGELSEETGLRCTAMRFLFYQDSLPTEPNGMHVVNLCFECDVAGAVALNHESSESRWIQPDEFGKLSIAFGNDAILKRYWGGVEN